MNKTYFIRVHVRYFVQLLAAVYTPGRINDCAIFRPTKIYIVVLLHSGTYYIYLEMLRRCCFAIAIVYV